MQLIRQVEENENDEAEDWEQVPAHIEKFEEIETSLF